MDRLKGIPDFFIAKLTQMLLPSFMVEPNTPDTVNVVLGDLGDKNIKGLTKEFWINTLKAHDYKKFVNLKINNTYYNIANIKTWREIFPTRNPILEQISHIYRIFMYKKTTLDNFDKLFFVDAINTWLGTMNRFIQLEAKNPGL